MAKHVFFGAHGFGWGLIFGFEIFLYVFVSKESFQESWCSAKKKETEGCVYMYVHMFFLFLSLGHVAVQVARKLYLILTIIHVSIFIHYLIVGTNLTQYQKVRDQIDTFKRL